MHIIKLLIVISPLFLFITESEAKKRCKPLLEKLHNVQAMQRNGYSSKRGSSLRAREDKARDKWWQCEQGRTGKNKSKKKRKDTKGSKNKSSHYSTTHKQNTHTNALVGTPFKTNNAIVIKSKYEGSKKQAWLKFYQQPAQCNRPKNLAVFAFCSENKRTQRINFEQGHQ